MDSKNSRAIATVCIALILSTTWGSNAASATPTAAGQYTADWTVVSWTSAAAGYGLCVPKVSNTRNSYIFQWNHLAHFPHGTIKDGNGVRIERSFSTGTQYFCKYSTARRFAGDAVGAQILIVINTLSAYTSNAGGGVYGQAGNYFGYTDSVVLVPGQSYCSSSCP